MTERIDNGILTAEVAEVGPELYSLQKDGREYIWQRDSRFWARSSPLLFPNVGRQKNDSFIFGDRAFPTKTHGVANELDTELIEKSEDSLTFESKSSDQTLKSFPFDFRIISNFMLEKNVLNIRRTVVNNGDSPFPFCIGEHTGFCCDKPEDAILSFEREETTALAFLDGNHYIDHEEQTVLKDVYLVDSNFLHGACILREWKSAYISLFVNERELLRVYRGDYPAIAIWRKPKAPFVCVEPIHGFDSDASDREEFLVKKNLVMLKPEERKSFSYSIMIK